MESKNQVKPSKKMKGWLKGVIITLSVCAGLFLVGFVCCTFIW